MNDLSIVELARQVTKLHNEIIGYANRSLEQASKIGEMLCEVKGKMDHGEWLPWLKNVPFSDRTARRYISVYENRGKLDTVSDLSDAYKLLTVSSGPPVPQAKPPVKSESVKPSAVSPKPAPQPAAKPKPQPAPEPIEQPKKKKLAQEFQNLEATRDETGMIVPDHLLHLWGRRREVIGDLLAQARHLAKATKDLQESEDLTLAFVNKQEVYAHFNMGRSALEDTEFYAVCTCLGKNSKQCTHCKGIGLLSKWFWKRNIPEEQKTMREKFIQSQS